jgi:hypothetical protein
VFVAILQDAWRQYRRRPVAVTLAAALAVVQLAITRAGDLVQRTLLLPLLVANLLLELFLVMRRSFSPGVRAYLLKVVYAIPAFFVGILLLGPRDTGPLSAGEQAKFFIGLAPLCAFAWAFLAVLNQRIVLDGERRVLRAAASCHRVAAANFPVCLVIAVLEALTLALAQLPRGFGGLTAVTLPLALVQPFRVAMSNALFQRTRALQVLEPQAGPDDRGRPRQRR